MSDKYNVINLVKGMAAFDIALNQEQIEMFMNYYEHLVEVNTKVNLTAITSFEDVVMKHFIDSLSIVKVRRMDGIRCMIDVGTGAGFPGIPIKIVLPDIHVTLLDALNKRVRFLNDVISLLGLSGIEAVHGRAEDCGRDPVYREQYDLCVSRAVANMSVLCEYCLPFVRVGGGFVSYKSGNADEELCAASSAIEKLGGSIVDQVRFNLPGTDITRVLSVIQKDKAMSKLYPRKAGLPSREPL